MDLKYFDINDDKDTLKKKWKKLAIQFHPDKNRGNEAQATKKMQEINSELEYCIKFGGGFDIGKYNVKNPNDITELIKMLMFDMIEDVLKEETNQSVIQFYTKAKYILSHGITPTPLIKVIRDDDDNNKNPNSK
jgi:hypothetical protein